MVARIRIIKHIIQLGKLQNSGKPLQYDLRNHRTVRMLPYGLIYRIEDYRIIINCFDYRTDVYD